MFQDAGVIEADEVFQLVGAAAGVDDVTGGLVTDPHVEPGGVPPDPPTRLVDGRARGGGSRRFTGRNSTGRYVPAPLH